MEHVEEYTAKLDGLVDSIIATCAINPEGDKTFKKKTPKVQKLINIRSHRLYIPLLTFSFLD